MRMRVCISPIRAKEFDERIQLEQGEMIPAVKERKGLRQMSVFRAPATNEKITSVMAERSPSCKQLYVRLDFTG